MNTDNMSVLGLTIDYGPYGWLEDFDPHWTPNTTDSEMRRYCYAQQPAIAGWNLARLGEAILPLTADVEALQQALNTYTLTYKNMWENMMADKLGLESFKPQTDKALLDQLQIILTLTETDMTIFYRKLANIDATINPHKTNDNKILQPIIEAYYRPDDISEEAQNKIAAWLRSYIQRLQQDGRNNTERKAAMNRINPKYILRNYLAQTAIEQATAGDYSEIHRLYKLLQQPYDEQPEFESYAKKRPDWARNRAGCSMLSCSS